MSQEYKDARRRQILEAAQRCFVKNGFHETSVQDLFDESGLSSGAFYRYFPSKEALIAAIAEENMRETLSAVREIAARGLSRPAETLLAELLRFERERHADRGLAVLAVQIWAEALLNERLRQTFVDLFAQLREELTAVVRQQGAAQDFDSKIDDDALAGAMFASIAGYLLQLAFSTDSASDVAAALKAIWSHALSPDAAEKLGH